MSDLSIHSYFVFHVQEKAKLDAMNLYSCVSKDDATLKSWSGIVRLLFGRFFWFMLNAKCSRADSYLCLTVEYSGELYEKIKFDFVVILISSANQ